LVVVQVELLHRMTDEINEQLSVVANDSQGGDHAASLAASQAASQVVRSRVAEIERLLAEQATPRGSPRVSTPGRRANTSPMKEVEDLKDQLADVKLHLRSAQDALVVEKQRMSQELEQSLDDMRQEANEKVGELMEEIRTLREELKVTQERCQQAQEDASTAREKWNTSETAMYDLITQIGNVSLEWMQRKWKH